MKPIAAIFGGSFDPPHLGHVLFTQYLLSAYQLGGRNVERRVDQVWWVPCYQHAFGKQLLSFRRRVKMCELALSTLPPSLVRISDIEHQMKSDGRMLFTLRELSRKHPRWRFKLAVGEDVWAQRKKWYRFNEIESDFGLIVVPRGGKEGLINVSSSLVRKRLKESKALHGLLPANVEKYIRSNRLYT